MKSKVLAYDNVTLLFHKNIYTIRFCTFYITLIYSIKGETFTIGSWGHNGFIEVNFRDQNDDCHIIGIKTDIAHQIKQTIESKELE